MISIKIYGFSVNADKAAFSIDVHAVPRVGERLDIHSSLCGDDFFNCFPETYGYDTEVETRGEFQVVDVWHEYRKTGPEIEVEVIELHNVP